MCPPKRKPSYGEKSKGEVVLPMDPTTVAAFPRCTATDRHCCRYLNDLVSPVTCLRRLPSSREGFWPKGTCRLDSHGCEDVALIEVQVLLMLALLSKGYHCTCLTGGP